jgi:hypothetical protein
MSPIFGRASGANQCPVSGVKQPCRRNLETAEFDPEQTSVLQGTNWPVAKSWAYPPN